MKFARIVLFLAALMFLVLGAWLLVAPDKLADWVGIVASTAAARTELRALYGGLEIGLAVFLFLGCLRPALTAPACLFLGVAMTSIAAARLLGFALDGSASGKLGAFLASEVLFAILGFLGFAKTRQP